MLNRRSHPGAPEFPSFLRLNNIPLYAYTTFCLSTQSLENSICIVVTRGFPHPGPGHTRTGEGLHWMGVGPGCGVARVWGSRVWGGPGVGELAWCSQCRLGPSLHRTEPHRPGPSLWPGCSTSPKPRTRQFLPPESPRVRWNL